MSKIKAFFVVSVFIFSVFTLVNFVLAEDAVNTPVTTSAALEPSASPSDTQWVWGEVVSVDAAAKKLTLKYLDYEADQEKTILLDVNENTVFENAKSLNELKEKDTLSVDYLIVDSKNIAKNVSLEKLDEVVPEAVSATENTSAEAAAQVEATSDQPLATTALTDSSATPVNQVSPEISDQAAETPAVAEKAMQSVAPIAESQAVETAGLQPSGDQTEKIE